MAKGGRGVGGGGGGGGSATLQRSKLNLTQRVRQVEPKLDNSGGDGGMGKGIFNGGGGDGGDGDDDDWFDNFEDGDGDGDGDGKSWIRAVVAQLYDEASINAVLSEWFRTASDLPGILRQSVAMGLFSSAQLVTFLQMDVRPSAARALTRVLPPRVSRDVVGRLMADPAFLQKALFEQAFAAFGSLRWEYEARGSDRFWKELDFVAVDTLSVCAATLAGSWLLAPSRAAPSRPLFGAVSPNGAVAALPNHAFDASSPARRFSNGGRAASVAARGVELAAVGGATTLAATAATEALTQIRRALPGTENKNFVPAAPAPSWSSAATTAAAFGLFSNARLQALGGADRWLFEHARSLVGGLGVSAVLRGTSAYCQHKLRVCAQGLGAVVPAAKLERQRLAEEEAARPKVRKVRRTKRRIAAAVPAAAESAAALASEGASEVVEAAADAAAAAPVRRRRKKRVASGFEMEASLA